MTIHHRVDQGSPEWIAARLGIPTASQFHRIITPAKLEYSKQARGYMFWLIAERLLNRQLDSLQNLEWIARGKELEPQAVQAYEFHHDVSTEPCGFLTTDDGRIGATPDRLIVGQSGAVELKCPAPQTHIEYMVDGFGSDYIVQVQGQMLVGELEFVDRWSYHPELPPHPQRTYRDEKVIDALRGALSRFLDDYDRALEIVKSRGFFDERRKLETATDKMAKEMEE